ncbi:MAG: hypothetical protein QW812_03060 [Thermoplasmataceae archaeon]
MRILKWLYFIRYRYKGDPGETAMEKVDVPSTIIPDLSPMEFLWKSIKRINYRTLIASEMHLKAVIESAFDMFSMFNSSSMGWIRKFAPMIQQLSKVRYSTTIMRCSLSWRNVS